VTAGGELPVTPSHRTTGLHSAQWIQGAAPVVWEVSITYASWQRC